MEEKDERAKHWVVTSFLSSFLLCGFNAVAVETEPSDDAGVMDVAAASDETTAPEARGDAPAAPPLVQTDAVGSAERTDTAPRRPLTEREKNRLARRERVRKALEEAIRIEGPFPDDAKLAKYSARSKGGVALIVIGAVTGVLGPFIALFVGIGGVVADPEGDGEGDDAFTPTVIVTVTCGAAMIATGIPLAVSGRRGKNRQYLLQRKDEILAPLNPIDVSLMPFVDPERGTGGLRLHVVF